MLGLGPVELLPGLATAAEDDDLLGRDHCMRWVSTHLNLGTCHLMDGLREKDERPSAGRRLVSSLDRAVVDEGGIGRWVLLGDERPDVVVPDLHARAVLAMGGCRPGSVGANDGDVDEQFVGEDGVPLYGTPAGYGNLVHTL
ncbi:hypothetical protein ACLOJK_014915 [Asimina triloba]